MYRINYNFNISPVDTYVFLNASLQSYPYSILCHNAYLPFQSEFNANCKILICISYLFQFTILFFYQHLIVPKEMVF